MSDHEAEKQEEMQRKYSRQRMNKHEMLMKGK